MQPYGNPFKADCRPPPQQCRQHRLAPVSLPQVCQFRRPRWQSKMRRALPYQPLGFLLPVILPHTLGSCSASVPGRLSPCPPDPAGGRERFPLRDTSLGARHPEPSGRSLHRRLQRVPPANRHKPGGLARSRPTRRISATAPSPATAAPCPSHSMRENAKHPLHSRHEIRLG